MEKWNVGGKNISTFVTAGVIAAILILLFTGSVHSFQSITHEAVHEVSTAYMEELGATLNTRIQAKAATSCDELILSAEPLPVEYAANIYSLSLDCAPYLMEQCENSDISYMAMIGEDGTYYGSDGRSGRLAEAEMLSDWLSRGRTYITSEDVRDMSLPLDDTLLYYLAAIEPFDTKDDTIVAMLGGLDSSAAATALGNDVGNSAASIITVDGELLFYPDMYASKAHHENLFNLLDEYADFSQGGGIDDIKEAVAAGESYMTNMMVLNLDQFFYFTPLGQTDLYICVAMPAHSSGAAMEGLSNTLIGSAILIIVCVVIAAFLFSYLYARSVRNSRELLAREKERAEHASDEARQASLAKSDFLSRMSHEIRTPLSGVIGMTEVALRSVGNDQKTIDSLKKIDLSSKHLLSLINDILDMSKIEQGKMEVSHASFSLRALIDTIDVVTKEQAAIRSINFKTIFEEGVDDYYIGDQLHLSQILYNLLSNALKFTPEGGHIVLHISKVEGAGKEHEPESQKPGEGDGTEEAALEWLSFVVSDTGCGIDEEFQKIIFDPFEQGHVGAPLNQGGTGLGLAITKRFSELMGGGIRVSSIRGKGAVFTLALPFVRAENVFGDKGEAASEPTAKDGGDQVGFAAGSGPVDFAGRRILVVEDNELNREIALELVGLTNATVESVENGAEAVERFKESEPGYYDMILMDIQMPLMNGYEATKAIRALDRPDAPAIPIVAMTANAFQEDIDRCIEAGMSDHVSKPLDTRIMFLKMQRFFKS